MPDMLTEFTFTIVSPNGVAAEETAVYAKLFTEGNELGILPNHSPLLAKLIPGNIEIETKNGATKTFSISAGFAQVLPDKTLILVDNVNE